MRYLLTFIAAVVALALCVSILDSQVGFLIGLIAAAAVGWYTYTHYGNYSNATRDTLSTAAQTVVKAKDHVTSSIENEASAVFFAQAEDEVDSGSYDKGLWSQALVKANGDESKRKIAYMQLRSAQLQRQSRET